MKIVAVNGGPRKNCNTAQLLDSFLNGVREAAPDAEIEVIHLYDYLYTGCKSCFACQLTVNREDLGCRVRDSITELLRDIHVPVSGFSKCCIGMALTDTSLKRNNFKQRLRNIEKINGRKFIKIAL